MTRLFRITVVAFGALSVVAFTAASSISPCPWDESVAASDFVGVVQCTGAGFNASRFRVVDTWFGQAPAGDFIANAPALYGKQYVYILKFGSAPRLPWTPVYGRRQGGLPIDMFPQPWSGWREPDAEYVVWQHFGGLPWPPHNDDEVRQAFYEFKGKGENLKEAIGKVVPLRKDKPVAVPLPETARFPRHNKRELSDYRRLVKSTRDLSLAAIQSPWIAALGILAREDPHAAASYLRNFSTKRVKLATGAMTQELSEYAEYVASNLPAESRVESLQLLCKGKEPAVQLAGAMQLSFVDLETALPVLEKISRGVGNESEWANITLAFHGDKTRFDRVLREFGPYNTLPTGQSLSHEYEFELMFRALLSNSAAQSGLPQPEDHALLDRLELSKIYRAWWDAYKDRVEIVPLGKYPVVR
ncbi:MAG: hypothetical protein WC655_28605 [Candidatus Hydrogenedentales bacterium]|jgi:hypothetical protein